MAIGYTKTLLGKWSFEFCNLVDDHTCIGQDTDFIDLIGGLTSRYKHTQARARAYLFTHTIGWVLC